MPDQNRTEAFNEALLWPRADTMWPCQRRLGRSTLNTPKPSASTARSNLLGWCANRLKGAAKPGQLV
jgi:hypothetical protein